MTDLTAAADHPHTDPGDGRTECQRCGKWVWPVIHSCKGVPVTDRAKSRLRGGASASDQTAPVDMHTIVVRVTPTTHDRVAVHTNSTHPDPRWTARALQLAAEALLMEEDGPAITASGHLVERHTQS